MVQGLRTNLTSLTVAAIRTNTVETSSIRLRHKTTTNNTATDPHMGKGDNKAVSSTAQDLLTAARMRRKSHHQHTRTKEDHREATKDSKGVGRQARAKQEDEGMRTVTNRA
jgi:hypothetical protein